LIIILLQDDCEVDRFPAVLVTDWQQLVQVVILLNVTNGGRMGFEDPG